MKYSELVRRLRRLGIEKADEGARHEIWIRAERQLRTVIPATRAARPRPARLLASSVTSGSHWTICANRRWGDARPCASRNGPDGNAQPCHADVFNLHGAVLARASALASTPSERRCDKRAV